MKSEIKNNKKTNIIVLCIIAFIIVGAIVFKLSFNNYLSSNEKEAIIYPSLTYKYDTNGNSFPKDTQIKFTSKFVYIGLINYYYQARIYAGGTEVIKGECRKITNNLSPYYEFKVVVNDEYAVTSVYKTKDCSGKSVKDYKSKSFNVATNTTTQQPQNAQKTFTATFDKQYATKIGSSSETCSTTESSCTVKAPTITRSGAEILGWDTNSKSVTPKYKAGDDITLVGNQKYYAITRITYTATFNKNGATSIGKTSATCKTTTDSCTVDAPKIEKKGATILGWDTNSKSKTASYKVGSIIPLKSNTTYYAITSNNKSVSMTKYTGAWFPLLKRKINVTVSPSTDTYTVTSSNPSVIRINYINGVYSAIARAAGTATITVKSSSGATDTATYTVIGSIFSTGKARVGTDKYEDIDGVKVYAESSCNKKIIDQYKADIKNSHSTLRKATQEIYFVTKSKFHTLNPTANADIIGMSHSTYYLIDIVCDEHYSSTVHHEMAHNADYRYGEITGTDKSRGEEITGLYEQYKVNQKYLRDYSYKTVYEFYADLIGYKYSNVSKLPQDLLKAANNSLNEFKTIKGWGLR